MIRLKKSLVEMGNILFILLRRIIHVMSISSGSSNIEGTIWAGNMRAVKRETDAPNFVAAASRPACTLKGEAEWVVDRPIERELCKAHQLGNKESMPWGNLLTELFLSLLAHTSWCGIAPECGDFRLARGRSYILQIVQYFIFIHINETTNFSCLYV